MKVSYKLILWFFMWMVRYLKFQSSLNSKFAMALQYLKKEVTDKVDFLHADKHRSFLQNNFKTSGISFLEGDTIIIDGHDQAFSNYSK